ncbi:hypothetical protein [Mangrovimonas yunxiaonensis]|uniref:hypothetical protein n=1 Tax=Mangrovimonas yunxiaonensis TaxID=1197477 RepID=UPI000689BFF0|nr:hypothetical protein [Mangrovimonas yunxiaonensis]GGH42378.1 hypothetical protein GCM10011364_13840 [Mangrovimonas yunxiaonensis]
MLTKTALIPYHLSVTLISEVQIITILLISTFFFLILLILGIKKSYKLRKENDRLNEISALNDDESDKAYKDFTDGHLYE